VTLRATENPFSFVQRIEPAVLARELAREQPQTVAAVLAHLPPAQAAAVLEVLPTTLATDALERMATIDQLAPEVLSDLEGELRSRLAPHLLAAAASVSSLQRLTSVLEAMDFRQRQRVVLQLTDRNTALAGRLGLHPQGAANAANPSSAAMLRYRVESSHTAAVPQTAVQLEFSDLAELDDQTLRGVFASAEPAAVLLALTGAEQRLVDRVLRRLPAHEAAALRRRLDQPGPLRLREIDAAQRELAAIASNLIHEGRANAPGRARFAAAA
jgi:flagellar motor switch protein FliG